MEFLGFVKAQKMRLEKELASAKRPTEKYRLLLQIEQDKAATERRVHMVKHTDKKLLSLGINLDSAHANAQDVADKKDDVAADMEEALEDLRESAELIVRAGEDINDNLLGNGVQHEGKLEESLGLNPGASVEDIARALFSRNVQPQPRQQPQPIRNGDLIVRQPGRVVNSPRVSIVVNHKEEEQEQAQEEKQPMLQL